MKTATNLALLFLLVSGCVTAPDGTKTLDVERVAVIANSAAYVGTALHLRHHPKDRPMFVASSAALAALDASGDYDPLKFSDALSNLPLNALAGPDGDLYVSTAIVIWDALSIQAARLDTTLWVKPVLKAVRAGMDKALAIPTPP